MLVASVFVPVVRRAKMPPTSEGMEEARRPPTSVETEAVRTTPHPPGEDGSAG